MLLASLLLLAGCKQKSGFDQLTSQMDNAKAIKSQYVVQVPGQADVVVECLYTQPDRVIMTSKDFVVATNSIDGHFESMFATKQYDSMPWDNVIYPGTGQLVSAYMVQAGPATAINPNKFYKDTPWKLIKKVDGVESYSKEIQTLKGVDRYELYVDSHGKPLKFTAPGDATYQIKSFEIVDDIPMDKFRVEPREGFVAVRTQMDFLALGTGQKFSWSQFTAAPDVSPFRADGFTVFAFVDPTEPTSEGAIKWLSTAGKGYKKVSISRGQASSGFFDKSGVEFDKLTTSSPTFVLIDKDSKIIGMWQGFDPNAVAAFDKDIELAIKESGER